MMERILNKSRVIKIIVFTVLISFLLIIIPYLFAFYDRGFSGKPSDWAAFSDYVGGLLNPSIALAALLALLYAVHVQEKELSAAQNALSQQVSAINEQIFDAKFFSIFSLFNESISTLKYVVEGRQCEAYEAVRCVLYEFYTKASEFAEFSMRREGGCGGEISQLLDSYSRIYLGTSTIFMVVDRVIHIAELIESSHVVDKRAYHRLASSYLSEEMKVWMYMYSKHSIRRLKIPGDYGCWTHFSEYAVKELPSALNDVDSDVVGYVSGEIIKMAGVPEMK